MFAFEGATATAPTAAASTLSEMFVQVTPLFVVFHSPPLRAAVLSDHVCLLPVLVRADLHAGIEHRVDKHFEGEFEVAIAASGGQE